MSVTRKQLDELDGYADPGREFDGATPRVVSKGTNIRGVCMDCGWFGIGPQHWCLNPQDDDPIVYKEELH